MSDYVSSNAQNRLVGSTSPYLLMHADNPVEWQPWDQDALDLAKRDNKPIFLSIGFLACHWCRKMESETFANPVIAEQMNSLFVNIKVDREERPDLDVIYSAAVFEMVGEKGWPINVFLTPDLNPFYGGTYYPPEDRWDRPGFQSVFQAAADAWVEDWRRMTARGADFARKVRIRLESEPERPTIGTPVDKPLLDRGFRELQVTQDAVNGGWGNPPKFPSSASIEMLLRHWKRTQDSRALQMATFTLGRMVRGGIYDHVGGGFHQCSIDAKWMLPHFEKMLYDNAQMAIACLEMWQATHDPLFKRVATETLDYVLRELGGEDGEFYSSQGTDGPEAEEHHYLWSEREILDVLGPVQGKMFCNVYSVTAQGNFVTPRAGSAGLNILHMTLPVEDIAKRIDMPPEQLENQLAVFRERLRDIRQRRVRPILDTKAIAAWNGLMISACARGAQILEKPRYAEAAAKAGRFVFGEMFLGDFLARSWRGGQHGPAGYLDDYACVANGLLDLYETDFDPIWIEAAAGLVDVMLIEFDGGGPLLYRTSRHHTRVVARQYPTLDQSEPSGNAMAATVLLRLAEHYQRPRWRDRAVAIIESQADLMAATPSNYMKMFCAADRLLADPLGIVVAKGQDSQMMERGFLRAVHSRYLPQRIIARNLAPDGRSAGLPLTAGLVAVNNATVAYLRTKQGFEKPYQRTNELENRLDRSPIPKEYFR